MKIVVSCDVYVRPEMFTKLKELEKEGHEIVLYDNPLMSTKELEGDVMLKTEQNGADAVKADPTFVKLCEDADIIVVQTSPITTEVIESAKNLKLVGCTRGGCDNVNTELLKSKGIPVVHSPTRSAYAVADYAIGMMIAETKNIARGHANMVKGVWETEYVNSENYTDMRNKTIGIIGFGNIGQILAQELKGFGSHIIVFDPYIPKERIEQQGYEFVELNELLKTSDIVTIHLRCSEKTLNFISQKELDLMKPTATLINTARAGLINQNDLINTLKQHKIMGCAIDVYEDEPLPSNNPYRELDNVTLTPHLAGLSNDTFINGVNIVSEDVIKYIHGEQPKFILKY